MNEYQQRLFERLLEKNNKISASQAQVWVELLWEDFEATYAKAGREYKGSEMAEKVVSQWIEHYGDRLHEFAENNSKYKHLLSTDKNKLN